MALTISPRKRKADKSSMMASSSSPAKQRSSPKKRRRPTSLRVEVAPPNPEYDPIVVSFPRGVPSSLTDADGRDEANAPRFTSSRLKPTSSRGRRIEGEDETCAYAAAAAGRGHDGRLTKAYVCVYDKTNKTLKLVPAAEKGTVFALEQSVKDYRPTVENGAAVVGRDDEGKARATTAAERVQMLVESFGSKKKQKVMASRSANKVNIHSVVGAGGVMMDSVAKQEGISRENKRGIEEGVVANPNDVAYEQARKKMLPPFNADADTPSKVYSAQSIAGDEAWSKVCRVVDAVVGKQQRSRGDDAASTDWIESLLGKKGYRPPSVMQILEAVDPTKKAHHAKIKAAFLLYLVWKFRDRIVKRGMVRGPSLDDCINALHVTHEVGARLFGLFTSPMDGKDGQDGGYVASKMQKDKLSTYLLVLYVIAAGGREMKAPSINQLCKDMKLDPKDASMMLREAGFVVKRSSVGDVGASLPVPLKFPPPKRGKRT